MTDIKFDHGVSSVFYTHFLSDTHRFKVILAFLIIAFGGMPISTASGVQDRKRRHQGIERPWLPISVQYMFCVYRVPFTSYFRLFIDH
jgi:hypothetical protein